MKPPIYSTATQAYFIASLRVIVTSVRLNLFPAGVRQRQARTRNSGVQVLRRLIH